MLKTCLFTAGLLSISCLAIGCGGGAPPAEHPEAAAADEQAPEPSADDEAGHDLDVGMEFSDDQEDQDQSDDEADEEHEPPPTQTYSPASRMQEDSKAIGGADGDQ